MFAQNSIRPFGSRDLGDCFRALAQQREMALTLGRFPFVQDFLFGKNRSGFGRQPETLPKSIRLKSRFGSIPFL